MRKQPIEFRQDEVTYVMNKWRATQSCSLIGVGSVGKTNLLHHLSDNDVQQHYLGQSTNKLAIVIDPHLLSPINQSDPDHIKCWAGYELMMHRLYMSLYPFELLGDDAQHFFDAYQAMQDGSNSLYSYMALRYFEVGIEYLMRRGITLVFMFDEFEALLRLMPAKFFQTLRGIRDNYKTQLAYLTFSREPLPNLVTSFQFDPLEMEAFVELFTDNTYYVGPYNHHDATVMMNRLMNRNPEIPYTQGFADLLLDASGRFAGLLRASFAELSQTMATNRQMRNAQIEIEQLALRIPVKAECQTIWNSLSEPEQRILFNIAHGINEYNQSEQVIPLLVKKRLLSVNHQRQTLHIEPPLFRQFVINFKQNEAHGY